MPRINDYWMKSIAYIYAGEKEAITGSLSGSCGFLFGHESKFKGYMHVYVVTNSHAVNDNLISWVRTSRRVDDEPIIIPVEHRKWHTRLSDCDLALCHLSLENSNPKYSWILRELMLTPEYAADMSIGPGDDVFMIGRFTSHDGGRRNSPSVRGGILAKGCEIVSHIGHRQESFLVEMKSIPGCSGSPVFIDFQIGSYRPDKAGDWGIVEKTKHQPWERMKLLGIDCGHFSVKKDMVVDNGGSPVKTITGDNMWVKSNTGISIVLPAWKIGELLAMDAVREEREEKELTIDNVGLTAF